VLDTITTPLTAPSGGAPAQPLAALKLANTRRTQVAELKARLRRHELTLAQLVLDAPEQLHGYLLFELLLWAPGFGRDRLRTLNARAIRGNELNLANELGALTARQRQWLADQLT
jgi:hypothetical protein